MSVSVRSTAPYKLSGISSILPLPNGLTNEGRLGLPMLQRSSCFGRMTRKSPIRFRHRNNCGSLMSFLNILAKMALFKVNTGCRDQEVCNLRWEWEVEVPELKTSVFIIPADRVKNRQDRLVVLNRVAKSVIEEMRGGPS